MNKKTGIKIIREIMNGSGIDRNKYPESWKGSIARNLWDKGEFTLGIEYGYILALKEIFNINEREIKNGE